MPDDGRAWAYADVLPLRDAARRLRFRRAEAEAWLREQGLVSAVAGRERVHWGAVCERLDELARVPVHITRLRRSTRLD